MPGEDPHLPGRLPGRDLSEHVSGRADHQQLSLHQDEHLRAGLTDLIDLLILLVLMEPADMNQALGFRDLEPLKHTDLLKDLHQLMLFLIHTGTPGLKDHEASAFRHHFQFWTSLLNTRAISLLARIASFQMSGNTASP